MKRIRQAIIFVAGMMLGIAAIHAQEAADVETPGDAGSGLRGAYYSGNDFQTIVMVRLDSTVEFNWGGGSPDDRVPRDNFSVRWTGKVRPRYSEKYTFRTDTDDGVRLWVNGSQLINNWNGGGGFEGHLDMEAGKKYDVRMEFREFSGGASARLSWNSASQKREIIPSECLFPSFIGRITCTNSLTVPESAVYVLSDYETPPRKISDLGSGEPTVGFEEQVAFTSGRHTSWGDPKTIKNTEIYVMKADGSGQRRLTNNWYTDMQPSFGAEGSKIVYVANKKLNWDIFIMNYDGSMERQLTDHRADDINPCLSPDGSKIVFQSARDAIWNLYAMDSAGKNVMKLTEDGGYNPVFSPDGRKIAFVSDRDGNPEIYLMNADGSDVKRLTENQFRDDEPTFSPDGGEIAFVSDRDMKHRAIYVMAPDGSGVRQITTSGDWYNLSWGW